MRDGLRYVPGRHLRLTGSVVAAASQRTVQPSPFPDVPAARRPDGGDTGEALVWRSGSTVSALPGRVRQLCAPILLLTSAICAAALVTVAIRSRPPAPATARIAGVSDVVRGVQTSVVQGDRLTLRVSADRVALTRPRVLGPFRVGFLRAISARNLTIETWEALDGQPQSAQRLPSTGALAAVLSPVGGRRIAQASAERVRLVRHLEGAEDDTLEAQNCETTVWNGLVCRHGTLHSRGESVRFRQAAFDSGRWVLDGREPHQR